MTPTEDNDNSEWDTHLKEAQELFRKGEYEGARALFGQLLSVAPEDIALILHRAQSSFAMGDYPGAEQDFKAALNLDETNDAAWFGLALSLYRQGRLEDSVIALERALEISPDDPDSLMHYGLALHSAGRYSEAIEAYERLLSINPSDPRVHVNYALSLMSMDRYRDAEGHFRQALEVDEKARTWFELGDVLFRMNEFSGAEDAFKRALELAPEMDEAKERLLTLHALGKNAGSEMELRDETIAALERERRLVEKEYERITSEKERIVREKERLLAKKAELEEKTARLEESLNIVEMGKEKVAKEREELERMKGEIEEEWGRIQREYHRFEERKKEIVTDIEELRKLRESLLEAREELRGNRKGIEMAEQTLRKARENLEREKEKMDSERAELNRMREELLKERERVERERKEVERLEYSRILDRVREEKEPRTVEARERTGEKTEMEVEVESTGGLEVLMQSSQGASHRIQEDVERIVSGFSASDEEMENREMKRGEMEKEKRGNSQLETGNRESGKKETETEEIKRKETGITPAPVQAAMPPPVPEKSALDTDAIDALLSGRFAGGWTKFEEKRESEYGEKAPEEVSPEAPLTNHLNTVLREGKTVNYFECPDCGYMIEITTTKRPLEVTCPNCNARFRLKGKKQAPPQEEEKTEEDMWDEKSILAEKAINYHKKGDIEKALEIYDLMLQISENDPVVWNNKGVALDSIGRHTRAEECYLRAIQIRKGYTDAWFNLAYSQYRTKQYERAMDSLRTLLRLKPDHEEGKELFDRCEAKLKAWKKLL